MKTNYLTEAKGDTIRWLRSWFSPSENPNVNPPAEPVAPPAPKAARTNGPTILVVDDDPVFLKATAMKLENNGFEVITAKDGSEAIQAARRKKPNLLVLDVNFPPDVASGGSVPWDGFRIMSWLRRFDDFKLTPVVMASMGDPIEYTRQAIRSGATAFFHKQMNPNQLLAIVKVTLARSGVIRAPGLDTNFQI
ncbi:MAG: response regulator transcription factor [Verrucomicrobiota bacterium]|nr:response regulator transcription factor [Verrucomicrobiota bacterium]